MTVRTAVEKAETAAVEKAKAPTLAQIARQYIDAQAGMLDAVLPAHVDRRRFAQMTVNAVRQAPDLAACFSTKTGAASFLLAAGQAAAVGLEPNTPTQECWLLPRKRGRVQEAQLSIGYRGLLKLARRSGTIQTIYAEVVREQDHFVWARGLASDTLEFQPAEGDEKARGDLTHAYAVARFMNGGYQFVVLDRLQVEARRASSESWTTNNNSSSPWVRWPEAMWRKSAIRALAPFLDLAPEAEAVIARDEQSVRFDPETGVIDVDEAIGELAAGDSGDSGDSGDTVALDTEEAGQLTVRMTTSAKSAEPAEPVDAA